MKYALFAATALILTACGHTDAPRAGDIPCMIAPGHVGAPTVQSGVCK